MFLIHFIFYSTLFYVNSIIEAWQIALESFIFGFSFKNATEKKQNSIVIVYSLYILYYKKQ